MRSNTSAPYEHFLAPFGRDGAVRLPGTPVLPKPSKAWVDAGHFRYSWPRRPKFNSPPARLCFVFARLAASSDDKPIRRFTGNWGPLGIEARIEETPDTWRRYARLADALLRFMADDPASLRQRDKDWCTICEFVAPGTDLGPRGHWPADKQMAIAAAAVNKWFTQARGQGILTMVGKKIQFRPHGATLFGTLILQIAHVMAHADHRPLCAGCNKKFTPTRPLARGARQYCKRCRSNKLPLRDAARDFRARLKLTAGA